MSGVLPPLQDLTPENQGPIVVVTAYVFVLISILFTTIRIANTFTLKRGFGHDDGFLLAATVIALVQTILIERAADNGMGRYIATLTSADLSSYYKFNYAGQILSIIAMACAKMSVVHLVVRLSQQRTPIRLACSAMTVVVALWTVFSVFGLALECQGAIWYAVILLNLLTDAVLAFFFAPVLWKLNMRRVTQTTVIFLFGLRIVVCLATIAQLAVLAPAMHATDQTRSAVTFSTLNQVVMNLSILTASAPSIHRFLADLQTGSNGTRIPDSTYGLSGYVNSKMSKPISKSAGANASKPRFTPNDGSKLSSRIFADHTSTLNKKIRREKSKEDSKQVEEENSTSSLTSRGVLQTWEISMEVENGATSGDQIGWEHQHHQQQQTV